MVLHLDYLTILHTFITRIYQQIHDLASGKTTYGLRRLRATSVLIGNLYYIQSYDTFRYKQLYY